MTHAQRQQKLRAAGIYLVTSQTLSGGRSTLEIAQAALDAGIRLIQLREKDLDAGALLRLARQLRRMTAAAGALLIINDRLDIAMAAEADGVHLGQTDLPAGAARGLAPELIIGISTHSVAEARRAELDGASYINIGPLFPTRSKDWAGNFLGLDGLREIAAGVQIPFTVMGGIKLEHIPVLRAAGADAIAVITAITAAPDPGAAARELLQAAGPIRKQPLDFH